MHHLMLGLLCLAATATAFALLEIQIEGPDGWAAKLPTWRIEKRWAKLILGGRPLTGYHLYSQLFLVFVLHTPVVLFDIPWNLTSEVRLGSFLVLFWITEDFLYFVFNPAFGIRKFKPQYIWWHKDAWWWIMPREDWVFGPLAVVLYSWTQ